MKEVKEVKGSGRLIGRGGRLKYLRGCRILGKEN